MDRTDRIHGIDEESQTPAPPVTFTGRKTLVAAAVAVVLIAGALLIRPAKAGDDARPPGPSERAAEAVGMGAPAAAVDLTALVADREKWVAAHPDDDASWAVLGAACLEQARRTADSAWFPKAEKALKRSLEVRPAEKGNFDAMTGMGALANARRDFGTGKKWGELVRAQAPRRWTAYPVLVDAYTGLGDYKAAQKATEQLLELRTGLAAYVRASQVYRDRGWREDAAVAMEHAAGAAKTPAEKAYALFRLGELSWERGDAAQALRLYEGSLRTDPAQAEALGGRARALAALGRDGEAVRDYRLALGRTPLPRLALELGELLDSLGRGEEARAPYGMLSALASRDDANGVDDDVVLGLYEADHGDPAAAVRRLSEEWTRHKSVQVADALGWALHQAGEDAAGLEYAKKATDLGLRSADFSFHRAMIERGLGDEAATRRHLEEAMRTNPHFSPLRAPLAKEALTAIGQPPPGGPENLLPTTPWVAPELPKAAPQPQPKPAAAKREKPEKPEKSAPKPEKPAPKPGTP
ncbi:tetratricopeptide repeat protein [Streptomyces sp. ISL-94]|uniref:tetratricopeptide repeat protein n=1 Tax=Streptomyces sp. ISL-94 TaxID=2819190 RepID=UPI001BE63BFE|nr:tetratricopeptide repeat protein [Streptomyces sp. ISL-94]MBT2480973.1 tetratricopeptide repeat protein [Streptomyces sp. ISL-94]